MVPFSTTDEALKAIDNHAGDPADFELPISDVLLDPVGINMAVITDRIMVLGWEPVEVEQKDGYRICRYKEME